MHKFISLAVWFVPLSACALDPAKPPGRNFASSIYKLQTPLTNIASGGVQEIFQPQLASYSSNIFYTAADGAITDLGKGITDWPAVFAAAGSHVRYYVWEYDGDPDPFKSADIAYRTLSCAR